MPGISRTIAHLFRRLLLAILLFSAPLNATTQESEGTVTPVQVLRIPHVVAGTNPLYDYITTLLARALDANAEKCGAVRLLPNPEVAVQERQLRNLNNRLLDITWSITSIDRERQYRAIRIPLVDGFFGKRVLLINKHDPRFGDQLETPQLKSMFALQGYDWPDSRILRHNNFKVTEVPYQSAFRLLGEGFADYFPRSLLEVGSELKQWQHEDVVVAPGWLLTYPSAMFFFVSKSDEKLALRIEDGLQQLHRSGAFSALLHNQTFYKEGLKLATERREIALENPLLSEDTVAAIRRYTARKYHSEVPASASLHYAYCL